MPKPTHTALSFLRTIANDPSGSHLGHLPHVIRRFHAEKGFSKLAWSRDLPIAERAMHTLLLRNTPILSTESIRLALRMARTPGGATLPLQRYIGNAAQNKIIDRAATQGNNNARFIGEGAAAKLDLPVGLVRDTRLGKISIGIIGAGAAGIITASALRAIGFENIRVYEGRDTAAGIWAFPHVHNGTKNNPRLLEFTDKAQLGVAKGDGTKDGREVLDFINRLLGYYVGNATTNTKIQRVTVNDDSGHVVYFDKEKGAKHQILINCLGLGKPRELYDPLRMRTSGGRPVVARWQQPGLKPADVDGNHYTFIGLGNSTAEMISQLQAMMDDGVDCDYTILTHYPRDAVHNPSDAVGNRRGQIFRVFRDLTKPDLTGFQGDLSRTRLDYYHALYSGRIVSDVKVWSYGNGTLHYQAKGGKSGRIRNTKVFALCGYQHDPALLEQMSIPITSGHPAHAYDGEFMDRQDPIRGYFGVGALMDSPDNRNATVIPGIMYRMPDLLYSVIMRGLDIIYQKDGLLKPTETQGGLL